jgi:hypothetical protein
MKQYISLNAYDMYLNHFVNIYNISKDMGNRLYNQRHSDKSQQLIGCTGFETKMRND